MTVADKQAVVSEEDLLKSLTDLETKAKPAAESGGELVQVGSLKKSASDTLGELASENLRKAIDVSEVLDEAIALMGVHVDRSLESLQKSIQAGAERDHAIVRVLGDLKKSIDANTEAMAALLDTPAAPAAMRPVTTPAGQVLMKSTTSPAPQAQATKDPKQIRDGVLAGLERLVKSTTNSGEASRLSSALIKFETTGTISDADMAAALKA